MNMGRGEKSWGRETEGERREGRIKQRRERKPEAPGSQVYCCLSPRLALLRTAAQDTVGCCCWSCPSGSGYHCDAALKSAALSALISSLVQAE